MVISSVRPTQSEHLQRHGGAFTTANAQRGDTFFQTARLHCVDQGHHDARTAGADRVAECTGAAVDVDDVVVDLEVMHQRHRHHRKGLVDLPQLDVLDAPAGFGQCLVDGADGRRREPVRFLRVHRMADDARQRLDAKFGGARCAHQHQRGGAVVDAGAAGGGNRAVLLEGGFERRDLVQLDLARTFVNADDGVAGAALDRDRRDLYGKGARLGSGLRALHAGNRELVSAAPG